MMTVAPPSPPHAAWVSGSRPVGVVVAAFSSADATLRHHCSRANPSVQHIREEVGRTAFRCERDQWYAVLSGPRRLVKEQWRKAGMHHACAAPWSWIHLPTDHPYSEEYLSTASLLDPRVAAV